MQTVPRPVCVNCGILMQIKRYDISVVKLNAYEDPNVTMWLADLYRCPECNFSVTTSRGTPPVLSASRKGAQAIRDYLNNHKEDCVIVNGHGYYFGQFMSGIEVGDTVTVKHRAEDNERGWPNVWIDTMDAWIDPQRRAIVTEVDEFGIELDGEWYFPYFVLDVVEKE